MLSNLYFFPLCGTHHILQSHTSVYNFFSYVFGTRLEVLWERRLFRIVQGCISNTQQGFKYICWWMVHSIWKMGLILSCKVSSSYFIEVSLIYSAVFVSFCCIAKWFSWIYVCMCICPLLQGILPTQGSNEPRSPALQADSLPSELPGKLWRYMEKAMAAHSSTLAWRIPGTGEPGGLPSMGSHRAT